MVAAVALAFGNNTAERNANAARYTFSFGKVVFGLRYRRILNVSSRYARSMVAVRGGFGVYNSIPVELQSFCIVVGATYREYLLRIKYGGCFQD